MSDEEKLNNEVENENKQNDFSAELKEQKETLNAEEFRKKQDEYRNILDEGELVEIDDPYYWRVGFGRRLGAYLLDTLFFSLLFAIVMVVTGMLNEMMELVNSAGEDMTLYINELMNYTATRFLPLSVAVTLVYYSLEVIFARSLGKMVLGIIIGDANKKYATIPQLLLRLAIKEINIIFSLLVLITSLDFFGTIGSILSFVVFIGCFFVLGQRKQAFHDMLARTAVYYKDELDQLNR